MSDLARKVINDFLNRLNCNESKYFWSKFLESFFAEFAKKFQQIIQKVLKFNQIRIKKFISEIFFEFFLD